MTLTRRDRMSTTASPVFKPNPRLQRQVPGLAQSGCVAFHLFLQAQSRIECALRMVLVRDRRAEQREDAITGRLHDIAVIAMNRIDHEFQRGIDNAARSGVLRSERSHIARRIRPQAGSRNHTFGSGA
jgi:hypothetical protein